MPPFPSRPLHPAFPVLRTAGVVTGIVLAALGALMPRVLPLEPVWLALEPVLPVAGGLLILLCLAGRRVTRLALARLLSAIWATLMALFLVETGSRALDLDFHGEEAAWRRYPPYYREPRTPSGTVYYRRDGPETWTGSPIRQWLQLSGNPAYQAYWDEPEFTVSYDSLGFRHLPGPTDWEMVVVGDSFVELGCVPEDALHTTVLGTGLGRRVRNLGASNTGPFTHVHYLREFGASPSLREVVMVFYEGNDMADLEAEARAEEFHRRTGRRGYRHFHQQPSPLGALHDRWRRPPAAADAVDAGLPVYRFGGPERGMEVTLPAFAPAPESLSPETIRAWDDFLNRCEAFAEQEGVGITLAYMPCKARVLHGLVTPVDPRSSPDPWIPTALPEWVRRSMEGRRMRFLDLTPILRRSAEAGLCPYNPMVETHLNADGSRLVAQAWIDHLRPVVAAPPPPPSAGVNPG